MEIYLGLGSVVGAIHQVALAFSTSFILYLAAMGSRCEQEEYLSSLGG